MNNISLPNTKTMQLATVGLFFVVLMFIHPAAGYSGSSNMWVTDHTANCGAANVDEVMTDSLSIFSLDSGGNAGYWGWQVEVGTVQGNPAYQWVTNVKAYSIHDFFIQYLLSNGYDQGDITPAGTYYPGVASQNTAVETDGTFSSGYATQSNWWVWVNGAVAEQDVITYPTGYRAEPQAYQNVLVSDTGASHTLNFTAGAGYFNFYSGDTIKDTTCYPGWGTAESSNMNYAGSLSCNGGGTSCSQYYWAPSQIKVQSQNQHGSTITGYYTVLYNSGGGTVGTGYTPVTFTGQTSGASYSVEVYNYGSCNFNHWSDGNTYNPRSFTATSSMSFTAVYNC